MAGHSAALARRLQELESEIGRLRSENCRLRDEQARERREADGLVSRLRVSEERFSKAFHGSPDSINLNRLKDGIFLAVNRGFTDLTGYSEAEVVGRSSLDVDVWADPVDRVRLVRELVATGAVDRLAARFRMKDGTVRPGQMSARIIDVQGEPCILSITRDVSAERAAEEALRESEERLRTTIELAADGIAILDSSAVVRFMNRPGLEMCGRSAEEILGGPWADLLSPESAAGLPRAFQRLDRGETVVSERVVVRPDGSRLPLELNTRRMPDGSYLSVFRDLTERRRAEQERIELQRRMDQAARVESIGQLAAGIAHDFNNLLMPIMGSAALLARRKDLTQQDRAGISAIMEAAERAAELTRQILALGRKQLLRLEAVDVNVVAANAVEMLRRVIGEDVRMELRCAEDLPVATADAGQVHQVLLNLALNARDAMPDGGVLTISTSSFEADATLAAQVPGLKPGRHVRVDVRDTGVGMDEVTRARAFEPFFTTKKPGRGTGLGLASARGIAEQHGGRLWVTSEIGLGSVFSFCLPVAEQAGAAPRPLASDPGPPRAHSGESVLLAEDDPLVRAVMQQALEDDGYSVACSGTAQEVLRAAADLPSAPAALVTDVAMPGLSGGELYARLRERYAELRVLFVSGYAGEALADVRGPVIPAQVLPKPFTASALSVALRRVLDGS